jgi:hypothetical protein
MITLYDLRKETYDKRLVLYCETTEYTIYGGRDGSFREKESSG